MPVSALLQPSEQHPVRQAARQRIVASHCRRLGFGAPALGNILVGRDPSAAGIGWFTDGDVRPPSGSTPAPGNDLPWATAARRREDSPRRRRKENVH